MKKLIYLASPYSHEDQSVIERRVRQVQHATAMLIEAGHIIFSPIVHTHPIAELVTFSPINGQGAMSDWMAYDEVMIYKADELWVLMLEGWELSLGVTHEIEYAIEQGKPIRYVRYPEMYEEVNLLNVLKAPREISFSFEAELTPSGKIMFENLFGITHPEPAESESDRFFALDPRMMYDEAQPFSKDVFEAIKERIFPLGVPVYETEYVRPGAMIFMDLAHPENSVAINLNGEEVHPDDHILDSCNYAGWHGAGSFYTPPSTGQPPLTTEDARRIFDTADQKIIGLHGHAQVGKDEIAKYLIDRYNFVRVSLADPIREQLRALDPDIRITQSKEPDIYAKMYNRMVNSELGYFGYQTLSGLIEFLGWDETKKIDNVRRLLQRLGTEGGRMIFGENHWVDQAKKKIEAAYPSPVVITDVRFENEAQMIRDLGGQIVHVTRNGVGAINSHPSDKKLDDSYLDFSIPNHGTIEDLHRAIRRALTEYIYET